MKTFPARYSGTCICGDRFPVGAEIGYNQDGDIELLAIDGCMHLCDDLPNSNPLQDACPRCFLVHAGECF